MRRNEWMEALDCDFYRIYHDNAGTKRIQPLEYWYMTDEVGSDPNWCRHVEFSGVDLSIADIKGSIKERLEVEEAAGRQYIEDITLSEMKRGLIKALAADCFKLPYSLITDSTPDGTYVNVGVAS